MERQIIETIKPHSFEGRWGGPNNNFKIYFETIEELKEKIDEVIEAKKYLELKLKEASLEVSP